MKRRAVLRVLSVVSCFVLTVLLVVAPLQAAPPAAVASVPQVTVFLKNYLEEYDLATSEFLAAQFDDLDSPAYGLVTYTVTTSLTEGALSGSSALIIDASADMSLTEAEAALIRAFVNSGGKVGLFTFPRYYWDHVGPNSAAFQTVADLFGNATVGAPNAAELSAGVSSAKVTQYDCVEGLCFTTPYSVTGATLTTFDHTPFTPVTSAGTSSVVSSTVLGAPVAVANGNGLLVTNSIGDLVQGSDSNAAYHEFVTDAIVWLAKTGSVMQYKLYLPFVSR